MSNTHEELRRLAQAEIDARRAAVDYGAAHHDWGQDPAEKEETIRLVDVRVSVRRPTSEEIIAGLSDAFAQGRAVGDAEGQARALDDAAARADEMRSGRTGPAAWNNALLIMARWCREGAEAAHAFVLRHEATQGKGAHVRAGHGGAHGRHGGHMCPHCNGVVE